MKNGFLLFVSAVFVLLQLPYLPLGYGLDTDAWSAVRAGQLIAESGVYVVSRYPGNPVPELVYALFARMGTTAPVLLNAVTLVFAVVCFGLFWKIGQAMRIPGLPTALVAFACTPVVFASATVTMDYLWALAFVLGAFYAVLTGHTGRAGALLGLAIGCRLSSGVLLLPLIYWVRREKYPTLPLLLGMVFVGGACYLPALSTYGLGFLRFYDTPEPIAPRLIVQKATEGVFGLLGFVAVAVAFILNAPRFLGRRLPFITICGLVILLQVVVFTRLPHEAEYLIPAVPFVYLALWQVLRPTARRVVTVGLVVSCVGFAAFHWRRRLNVISLANERKRP